MERLDLHKVDFAYALGGPKVLHDINLSISKGERVAILGESGSGKSTLLGILTGLLRPKIGDALLDATPVADVSAHNRNFAVVFQRPPPLVKVTVKQMLLRPAQRMANETAAIAVITGVLAELGLENVLERDLESLSGGELQRVHIARSLVWRPDFIMLDEPLNSIDVRVRHKLYPMILERQREVGAGLIIVTHDPQEAALLCDRVVVLDQGRIMADMEAGTLRQTPPNTTTARLVAGFSANLVEVGLDIKSDGVTVLESPLGYIRGRLQWRDNQTISNVKKAKALLKWHDIISPPDSTIGGVPFAAIGAAVGENELTIYRSGSLLLYGRSNPASRDSAKLLINSQAIPLYNPATDELMATFEKSND